MVFYELEPWMGDLSTDRVSFRSDNLESGIFTACANSNISYGPAGGKYIAFISPLLAERFALRRCGKKIWSTDYRSSASNRCVLAGIGDSPQSEIGDTR
jgi:hypothetical protein